MKETGSEPRKTERARSELAFARARQLFPGGVNSPVRAYRAVQGTPPFIASGLRYRCHPSLPRRGAGYPD